MKAGKELDALIHNNIFGLPVFDPPAYSTEIQPAWLVVEKFRQGYNGKAAACIEVVVTDLPTPVDTYCRIYGPDTAEALAHADTAPLAICLAALKEWRGNETKRCLDRQASGDNESDEAEEG
jgi:hypothetical protein